MSDKQQTTNAFGGRFQAFGATLRQSAQEMTAKAAAQVTEQISSAATIGQQPSEAPKTPSTKPEAAAAPSPSLSALQKDDSVGKKEVIELLQKMNKKVKALTVIRQQLTEKVDKSEAEKLRLQSFVAEEILNGAPVNTETDVVPQLQSAWRQQDEQNSLAIQQLQREFQKLQMETQSNGKSNGHSDWEKEKEQLMEQHAAEIAKLRDDVAKAPATDAPDPSVEIQRVKEAAAAQIKEFKKKVATARNTEITKVKTEAAAAAKKIMESKLNEQKESFEKQMESLKSELASQRDSTEAKLRDVVQQHQVDLQKARAETTETSASANSNAENAIQEITAQHKQEIESLRASYEEKMSTSSNESSSLQARLDELSQQLDATRQSSEAERCSFEEKLAKAQEELSAKSASQSILSEQLLQLQNELKQMQETSVASVEAERKKLQDEFSTERQTTREEFQKKWSEAMAQHQAAAAQSQKDAIAKVSSDFTERFNKMKSELVIDCENKVKEAQTAADEARAKAEATGSSLVTELNATRKQLEEQAADLSEARERERRVVSDLEEARSLLTSTQSGNNDIAANMEEQLSKQRLLHEAQMRTKDEETSKVIESLKNSKASLEEQLKQSQAEVAASSSASESEVKSIQEIVAKLERELEMERTAAAQKSQQNNDMNEKLVGLAKELAQSREELAHATKAQKDLEQTNSKLQLENQDVQARLAQNEREHSDQSKIIIAELKRENEQLQSEMESLQGVSDTSEELEKLRSRLAETTDTNTKLREELEGLRSDIEQHRLTIRKYEETTESEKEARRLLEEEKSKLAGEFEASKLANNEEREKLRAAMESHVDKMTSQFKEKLETVRAKAAEDTSAITRESKGKDEKLSELVEKLKSLTASGRKLRDENETLKRKLDAEANAVKNLQTKLSSITNQLDETVANGSATASALLKEQESLEGEKATLGKENIDLKSKVQTLQSQLSNKSNKVEELTGKLQALSENLNVLSQDQREKDEQLELAADLETKLKANQDEVANLREQINRLKLERTKNSTLVEKLQAEKEATERSQGQRTALVSMLESQLSEMSDKNADSNAKLEAALYDLQQKDDDLQRHVQDAKKLAGEVEEARNEIKKAAEALTAAQKGADAKSSKMVETLQKEMQSTKQQMARKSAAAQRLLQQREAECTELRKANKALQQEVDKGSYSDRKIFELATLQSNRESYQLSEIETRDSIIDRLKTALLERDGDLATAEKHAHEVESQIEELFRIRRREDINVDYLKSIVVKYLSLPAGSTERAGLLPVLATLLQFDERDYKTIEEGKNRISWWGGTVVPTMINAPSTPKPLPAATGSAEVSVSTESVSPSGKRTSLQF